MSNEFRLPDVAEGIHEAEIVRWLVRAGESVNEFQPFVEVQTDKAVVEISSPYAGRITALHGESGEIVRVGDVIMEIEPTASGAASGAASSGRPSAAQATSALSGSSAAKATSTVSGAPAGSAAWPEAPARVLEPAAAANGPRLRAAPATRRLARSLGVELDAVKASGPGGRVTQDDVRRAAEGGAPSGPAAAVERDPAPPMEAGPADGAPETAAGPASNRMPQGLQLEANVPERVPIRGLRRVIAEHMVRSAFTAPHVTTFDDCDASRLVEVRKNMLDFLRERDSEAKLTYMPFFVKAVAAALAEFPQFNAHVDDERREILLFPQVHIGIAVDTPDGLMVPVLRNPGRKSVAEIQRDLTDLARRSRDRTVTAGELRGGTFSISSTGAMGGMYATPILNYPEVGILGVHKMEPRAVVRDGQIVIREMLTLSLSFDHRVIDGALGVRFLNAVRRLVEHPELLMV